jgi:hypothetical protein
MYVHKLREDVKKAKLSPQREATMRPCNIRKIAATRNYRLIKKAIDLSSTGPIPYRALKI